MYTPLNTGGRCSQTPAAGASAFSNPCVTEGWGDTFRSPSSRSHMSHRLVAEAAHLPEENTRSSPAFQRVFPFAGRKRFTGGHQLEQRRPWRCEQLGDDRRCRGRVRGGTRVGVIDASDEERLRVGCNHIHKASTRCMGLVLSFRVRTVQAHSTSCGEALGPVLDVLDVAVR